MGRISWVLSPSTQRGSPRRPHNSPSGSPGCWVSSCANVQTIRQGECARYRIFCSAGWMFPYVVLMYFRSLSPPQFPLIFVFGWMASSAANLDTETSLLEVLDRVLDKGIVMDARLRFSLVGVSLVEIEAPVVVASIETYLACQRTELIDARRAAAPGLTLHRET